MAKQRQKNNKKSKRAGQEKEPVKERVLEPGTARGIGVVTLFLLGAVFLLSLFDLAGTVGELLHSFLSTGLGWERFVIPVILMLVGYLLINPERLDLKPSNYIGFFLLVVSLAGIFHLFIPVEQASEVISDGQGGGYVGLAISYPLIKVMGVAASCVVLAALFIISVLLSFSTSLSSLFKKSGLIVSIFRRFRDWRFRRGVENINHQEEDVEEKPTESTMEVEEKVDDSDSKDSDKKPEQLKFFRSSIKKRDIDLPIDLLQATEEKPTSGDIQLSKEIIQKTLKNFSIEVEMGDVSVGPTVTQYTLKPADGVKIAQITTLQNDLALALAAHPIRIEAPIPGKSLVGIEIPNKSIATVKVKDIIISEKFKARKSNLSVGLGKDVAGRAVVVDLDPMPHLLIAGATGSGKSVCINSVIISLLYQNSPDDLKLILVDPKRVELTAYNDIPHLLTPVITETDKTINALKWIVREMDRRYSLLSQGEKKNIQSFNNANPEEYLPYIVLIIDELADLMSMAAHEVEGAILRLAQMARAVGIHLVVATQRPSVDVITGLIKANITSRIAFNVASIADSRTILDFSGAEKLLGRGDMLYTSAEMSRPRRIQGALVTDKEIEKVNDHLKEKAKPEYDEEVTEKHQSAFKEGGVFTEEEDEQLLADAQEVIVRAEKASASLLQRRLRIGYARAARVLDILEERGIIGPADGARPREVLIKEDGQVIDEREDENNNDKEF